MELPEQKSRAIATPDGAVFCTAEVSSAAGLSKWPEGFWGLSRCWALLHHTCARAQAHTGARTHERAHTHAQAHNESSFILLPQCRSHLPATSPAYSQISRELDPLDVCGRVLFKHGI